MCEYPCLATFWPAVEDLVLQHSNFLLCKTLYFKLIFCFECITWAGGGEGKEGWLSFQDPGIWGKGGKLTWGCFTPKNQEYASISISHIFLCAWQINTCLILSWAVSPLCSMMWARFSKSFKKEHLGWPLLWANRRPFYAVTWDQVSRQESPLHWRGVPGLSRPSWGWMGLWLMGPSWTVLHRLTLNLSPLEPRSSLCSGTHLHSTFPGWTSTGPWAVKWSSWIQTNSTTTGGGWGYWPWLSSSSPGSLGIIPSGTTYCDM